MYEIFNEDCLDGMKTLADGSVDLIATDPPYCVGATSNGTKASYTDFNLMRPFWEMCFAEWRRVLFATNGDIRREFGGGERDVWQIKGAPTSCPAIRFHPSQKPVGLMARMIQNSTAAGELVLDPFTGSATTAVACIELDRDFIGYELDERYFDTAQRRIDEAIAKREQSLFKLEA